MAPDLQPKTAFFPSALFDVVALATSAGGIKALSQVLSGLAVPFPAAIVIVQHINPKAHSFLADILSRQTRLMVKQARAGEALKPGVVYIAPPDQHLLIEPTGTIALAHTEKVHYARPSADRLFESVALSCGARAIAVVLTGNGQDGARGIQRVKQQGGLTIAQDPQTAEFSGMPTAAIQTQAVDWIIPLDQIAAKLTHLINGRGDRV
ncbi:chemotaxis protein CheB [Egbenema bharatensis]|uniref:chemotaxis protein CheB n=1 Tax=Egbenema bharatensis TaxID=3463334 RepID=UPI003A8632FE